MSLPTEIPALALRRDDRARGVVRYCLVPDDASAWVECMSVGVHEDHGGDMEPSHFSLPRLVWD